MPTNWFLAPVRAQSNGTRLFCLPYAGGSAAVYRPWSALLSPGIEVQSVQLAGRGWRLRDEPVADLERQADEVSAAILATGDQPFALFGHSMGAWLGLEVTRRLESAGRRPICFFASGRQAPALGCTQPAMAHLGDAEFVAEVQSRYDGIPAEILAEQELLALLLPALRADIASLESYQRASAGPVSTPIHAIVGDRDTVVSPPELERWREETSGAFTMTVLPGGHFYFQPDASALLDVIRQRLDAEQARMYCATRS